MRADPLETQNVATSVKDGASPLPARRNGGRMPPGGAFVILDAVDGVRPPAELDLRRPLTEFPGAAERFGRHATHRIDRLGMGHKTSVDRL